MLLNELVYFLLMVLLLFCLLLHFVVFEEPVGEVLDGIPGFVPARRRQPLGQDECDLVLFEICNV